MMHSPRTQRRLDIPSLALLLIGLGGGGWCYYLIADHGWNALIIVPSVVAATTGALHIIKREARRTP